MATCCGEEEGLGLPGTYNIKSRLTGDTWPGITFTLSINDEPIDFTDCVVEMAFRKNSVIGKLEWLLSSESDDITIDDSSITILPRLLTLSPGKYVYDLQVTFPDSTVRTYVKGSFQVLKDITP